MAARANSAASRRAPARAASYASARRTRAVGWRGRYAPNSGYIAASRYVKRRANCGLTHRKNGPSGQTAVTAEEAAMLAAVFAEDGELPARPAGISRWSLAAATWTVER